MDGKVWRMLESDGMDQNGALVDPRTVGYVVVYVDDTLTQQPTRLAFTSGYQRHGKPRTRRSWEGVERFDF